MDLALSGCLSDGSSNCENGAISKIYLNNGTSLVESNQWENNLTGVGYSSLSLGDIDNDGDLDLALCGCPTGTEISCTGIISKIYLNNGTSLVESNQWENNLAGGYSGNIKLVDINNDGKLDLGLTGKSNITRISKIYLNNGTSLVESNQWENNLAGVRYGMITFGDVDNDGDLDSALLGVDSSSDNRAEVYINNGTSLVETSSWGSDLKTTNLGSLIFGDYNNDGKIDLIETGIGDYLDTFNNTGSTFIMNQKSSGEGGNLGGGRYEGSIAFGDYNNDGTLDFVATGYEEERSSLYYNNNSNFFIIDKGAGLGIHTDDLLSNAVAWADLDNDNDLDLINIGLKLTTGLLAKVYISNASLTQNNTKPNPPATRFSSSYANNVLKLGWNNASDNETPSSGLYYNLMVGNETANNTLVSGVYGGSSGGGNAGGGADGYFGNMMQRRNISLNIQLNENSAYYWYVQTIDTGLAKSNWSAAQTFITSSDITKPNITINYPSPNSSLHTTNSFFVFNASVSDANLTNVSLYGNWGGSLHINQTNSSGVNGSYSFNANLTGYADGYYSWHIEARDSSNNSETSGRDFYLDRAYPLVYLASPADAESWTSSSTVTFSYNVSDTDIANCSLIINNAIDQTDDSITEDTNQTFTKSLSNADYTWSVNCTDYVGYTNNSATRSLTVSYTAPVTPAGSGGGGGSSTTTKTYIVANEQLAQGYTQQLAKDDKIKFVIANENHSLVIAGLTSTTATLNISSMMQQITLVVGQEKKIELGEDNYYDLLVGLNSISADKANITIKPIHEEILEEETQISGKKITEINPPEDDNIRVNKILSFLKIFIWIILTLICTFLIWICLKFGKEYFIRKREGRIAEIRERAIKKIDMETLIKKIRKE